MMLHMIEGLLLTVNVTGTTIFLQFMVYESREMQNYPTIINMS